MDKAKQQKEFPEEDEFPYYLLWQDIEEDSLLAKVVPWISLIIAVIILMIVIVKK